MSGETKLTCHYCGAECVLVFEETGGRRYVAYSFKCVNLECRAIGPDCDTPDAARDAHARVMRVPVWTKEVPKVPGFWLMKGGGIHRQIMRFFTADDVANPEMLTDYYGNVFFAGPIPEQPLPAEPAEGGGA